MTFTHGISTNNYGPNKFIVATLAAEGTHTTLASALAVASSGDTIYLRNSVTEDVTLVAGVNIVGQLGSELTPTVSITGRLSFSSAGTVTITGIRLTTNSDNFLAVSGTVASIVNLENCYLNCTNATGITNSSTSASSVINLNFCEGNLGTTGIKNYAITNASTLNINFCLFTNTGSSVTADTIANTATFAVKNSTIHAYTTSNTVSCSLFQTYVGTGVNLGITQNSTTQSGLRYVFINSGNVAALTIGAGATILGENVSILSTAANVITGAGAYSSNVTVFESGATYNVTTFAGSTIANPQFPAYGAIAPASPDTSDPIYYSRIYGGQTWSWGIDNSDSDAFVIAATGVPGTNNVLRAATTGEINKPLQPAFLASNPLANNVTGDATTYTIVYSTEIYDQNSDYDGSTTFTAPVTGRYLFCASVVLGELAAAFTAGSMRIVASNRTITADQSNYGAERNASNTKTVTVSHMVDMDAADTCTIDITVSGSTKTVDTNANGYFSGTLVC